MINTTQENFVIPEHIVQLPTDTTVPLSSEFKAIVLQELDALIANPVNGWDQIYPTLYKTLMGYVTEYASSMNCAVSALFLEFSGVNAAQARAMIMLDGSTRIYLGATFLKDFLLGNDQEQAYVLHRSFRWVVAHEVAHLADKTTRWWAKVFKLRVFFRSLARTQLIIGVVSYCMSLFPMFAQVPYQIYLGLGLGFASVYFLVELVVHHTMEYAADKASLNNADNFTPAEVLFALTKMNEAIDIVILQDYAKSREAIDQLFELDPEEKKSAFLSAFLKMQHSVRLIKLEIAFWQQQVIRKLYHPTVARRIAAIEKQIVDRLKV